MYSQTNTKEDYSSNDEKNELDDISVLNYDFNLPISGSILKEDDIKFYTNNTQLNKIGNINEKEVMKKNEILYSNLNIITDMSKHEEDNIQIKESDENKFIKLENNFDKIGLATTQGFFQHQNLTHNNFIIPDNKKIPAMQNTTQNFHKNNVVEIKINTTLKSKHSISPSISSINTNKMLIENNNFEDFESSNGGGTERALNKRPATVNRKKPNLNVDPKLLLYKYINDSPHKKLSQGELKYFLFTPIAEGKTLMCNVIRSKKNKNKIQKYFVFVNNNDRFIMAAWKDDKKNNFNLSMNFENLEKKSEYYIGKIASNYLGTEFNIFDSGKKPKTGTSIEDARSNLGTVEFDVQLFGLKKPRKVNVSLPKINPDTYRAVETKDNFKIDSLAQKIKINGKDDISTYINKQPEWSEKQKAFVLNFNGRVEQGSKKNFQLVNENDLNKVVLQFGKIKSNKFSMDFTYPLSPRQALGICISTLAGKLASG